MSIFSLKGVSRLKIESKIDPRVLGTDVKNITRSICNISVPGPVLFILYTASLSTVIEKHSVLHHSYADDSQLQKSGACHQIPDLLFMRRCTDDVKIWMTVNKLKLNDDNTEALIPLSRREYKSLFLPPRLIDHS